MSGSLTTKLTEHGRRLRIWAAEISPRGADDVIEMALRQVLRVARVVELEPWQENEVFISGGVHKARRHPRGRGLWKSVRSNGG